MELLSTIPGWLVPALVGTTAGVGLAQVIRRKCRTLLINRFICISLGHVSVRSMALNLMDDSDVSQQSRLIMLKESIQGSEIINQLATANLFSLAKKIQNFERVSLSMQYSLLSDAMKN